jgi:hypothetical protein
MGWLVLFLSTRSAKVVVAGRLVGHSEDFSSNLEGSAPRLSYRSMSRQRGKPLFLWVTFLLFVASPMQATSEPTNPTATNLIQGEVIILQKDDNLTKRISSDDLAQYIHQIDPICATHFSQTPDPGGVVFAIRPRGKSRFWIDHGSHSQVSTADRALLKRLEAISVPTVSENVVIVGIRYNVHHKESTRDKEWWPTPPEWLALEKRNKGPMTTEQIVDQLWPAED